MSSFLEGARCLFWDADVVDDSGVLIWDLEVRNIEAAKRILPLNIAPGDTYSLTFLYSRLSEEEERLDALSSQAIRSGQAGYQQEYRVRTASNDVLLFYEAVSIEQVEPAKWRLTGVCTDITEARRSSSLLAERESRYRTLFESNPQPIFLSDFETLKFLDVNKAALDLYGYTRQEILSMTLSDIRPIDELPNFLQEVSKAGPNLTVVGIRRHRRKDGANIYVEIAACVTEDQATGKMVRLTLVNDVTDRLANERALKKSEVSLASAQRLAGIGSWSYDARQDSFSLSDEFFHIVGHELGSFEPSWETLKNCAHPEDRSGWVVDDIIERASYAPYEREVRVLRPNGEVRHVLSRIQTTRNEDGTLAYVEGTIQDITDRKRADEELRWKTAFLEAQVNSSIDGIMVVDKAGKRILQNERVNELWKIPPHISSDPNGKPQLDHAIAMRKYPHMAEAQIRLLVEDPLSTARDEIELIDGTYLDQYSTPVIVPNDEYFGRLWIFRDITEQKLAAEQLESRVKERTAQLEISNEQLGLAKLDAEKANRAKSEFLSRMSHELRTPLNSILGFGQLLEMQLTNPEQKESIEYILKGGRHLLDLVNEILDITRLDSDSDAVRMDIQPIVLGELMSEVCGLMKPLANQQGVTLEYSEHEFERVVVLGDHQKLRQVLMNLLSNGIKFNHPGGHVASNIDVVPNERMRLRISDSGWGISTEDLERVFTPFDRLAAKNSDVSGTGLGLVLSRKLVESMGGSLTVESVLGQGSVFAVELRGFFADNSTLRL